ncbi:MAG TPA: hypothetical protein VGM81_16190 [Burkholderiaceae bacterium]|jgi:hypothetical protein
MPISAEGALLLLALVLYVFDSALLLQSNEWALEGLRGGQWRARFGLQSWKLGGREPLLPNLLMPWRPLLRVGWRFDEGLSAVASLPEPKTASAALKLTAALLLLLIFIALPLALFVYPLLTLKISVVAAIYASCLFNGLLLWRERAQLGLSKADCAKLGIECIACPPFAINIVRKLSLRFPMLDAAQALRLLPDQAAFVREQMLVRLREQIDFEAEGSPRMARLLNVAATLEPTT